MFWIYGLGAVTGLLNSKRFHEFILSPIFTGAVFAAVGFMWALVLGGAYGGADDFKKVKTETPIISLSHGPDVSGSFFFGTGSVRGHKAYTCKPIKVLSAAK